MSIVSRPRKLYVIGNGFDKHHGLPCGYADFRAWLQGNRPDVYRELNRLYGENDSDLWSDFEHRLACFDLDNYPYDVTRTELVKLKDGLSEAFGAWVPTIGVPEKGTAIEDIDKSAMFFTFNYTRTLEDFYGIDESRIVHLHGSVDNGGFIYGHDRCPNDMDGDDMESLRRDLGPDLFADIVHMKMYMEFADVFRKPVAEIIEEHKSNFEVLAGIKELIVLGFSYSDIDMAYLERIIEVTGEDIKATFSQHNIWDVNHALACSDALGVSETIIMDY